MSVWKKLITAVKGGVTEVAETVADSQALRILDQEIREAKEELRNSDIALTQIMAKRKLAEQKLAGITSSVSEYERHARNAAAKGDQALALDCAKKVGELRAQAESEQQLVSQFTQSETTLRKISAWQKTICSAWSSRLIWLRRQNLCKKHRFQCRLGI